MSPKPAARLPKCSSLQEAHSAMSRQAIAVELGCSQQRIGEIEQRALGKLRAALEARGFRLEDLL